MIKRIAATLAYISLLVFSSPILVVAREAAPAPEATRAKEAVTVPERDGTYDEPTARGVVKVRVIVHRQRSPVTVGSLVCGLVDPDSSAVVAAAGWHLPSSWTYN